MSNDFGTIKAVLPQAAQTRPTAPAQRPAEVEHSKDASAADKPVEDTGSEPESLDEVVSDLNNLVRDLHRELQFTVDDKSGDTVIKVVDRETDEVVRQIPSEEVMRMRRHLQETAGVIFQDSA